uniref:Serine-threonine/tyrosine-protein kinase catalytic domain-containing protein n=1 Tax=Oryza brachyantha TaxID=4533 RepID=J3MIG8_ORYBR
MAGLHVPANGEMRHRGGRRAKGDGALRRCALVPDHVMRNATVEKFRYAAPEMWMQSGVSEKCDVYSFGMHAPL